MKFSQPTDEAAAKASYESRLREWRKVRDNLETEGTHLTCKQNGILKRPPSPITRHLRSDYSINDLFG